MSDRWTVQILPEGAGTTRTLRLSRTTVVAVGGVLLALLVAGVAGLVFLGGDAVREATVTELRRENRQLTSTLESMQRRSRALGRELDRLAAREERFRLVAGLPLIDPEVRQVGVGGPTGEGRLDASRAISDELDQLFRRAGLLSSSISEATDSLRVHRDVFLSRPSIRPVAVEDSWISSSYARSRYHPVLLHDRPHEGVDISARHGAPIVSTARGVVRFAGWVPGYGRLVEVDHGYGYRTRYAHASRLLVRNGQQVERGEVLAQVGETGLTTGPNVHYEVIVDGRPVDPRPYLLDEQLFE